MTREEIITAMQERGMEAEPTTVSKNNVTLDGIIVKVGKISSVVYTDEIISTATKHGWTVAEVVERIMESLEANTPSFNVDNITEPDYIRDHVKIGIQRATNENIIKRPCQIDEAMECYLYIDIESPGNAATAKIKPEMIENHNIDLDALWSRAELNTTAETDIFGFSEFMGMPETDDFMWVITNKSRVKGAGNIIDKKALASFARSHGCNMLYALPSSVHEWIIMPYSEIFDIESLTNMVKEVNAAQVSPLDQLGDRAYIVTL